MHGLGTFKFYHSLCLVPMQIKKSYIKMTLGSYVFTFVLRFKHSNIFLIVLYDLMEVEID